MQKIDKEKLQKYMTKKFLNLRGLAKATGLSIQAISSLANGKATPRPQNLKKICDVLECEAFDILQNSKEE